MVALNVLQRNGFTCEEYTSHDTGRNQHDYQNRYPNSAQEEQHVISAFPNAPFYKSMNKRLCAVTFLQMNMLRYLGAGMYWYIRVYRRKYKHLCFFVHSHFVNHQEAFTKSSSYCLPFGQAFVSIRKTFNIGIYICYHLQFTLIEWKSSKFLS